LIQDGRLGASPSLISDRPAVWRGSRSGWPISALIIIADQPQPRLREMAIGETEVELILETARRRPISNASMRR